LLAFISLRISWAGHYKTIQEYGWFLYRSQPVEADAFAFAKAIRDGLYGGQQQ